MRRAWPVLALLLVACGPSAVEVEAEKARRLRLAEIQESIAASAFRTALSYCDIIRKKHAGGRLAVTDEDLKSCGEREAKRSAFVAACVEARADDAACELKAQRMER